MFAFYTLTNRAFYRYATKLYVNFFNLLIFTALYLKVLLRARGGVSERFIHVKPNDFTCISF